MQPFPFSLYSAIKTEEKEHVKLALLHGYMQCSQKSSRQVAEMIARIVRIEPLENWPALVPTLIAGIQSTDSVQQERTFLMLLHVAKGLSSKNLPSHRRQIEHFTNELYEVMLNLWISTMQAFMQSVKDARQLPEILHLLDKAVLTLKIIKKLSLFGIPRPKENALCNQFFRNFFAPIEELLSCRRYVESKTEYQALQEPLDKYIVRHMKFLYEFQEKFITDFVEHAPAVIQFSYDHLFGEKMDVVVMDNTVTFPAFTIYCFNLIKVQLGYDDTAPKYNRGKAKLCYFGRQWERVKFIYTLFQILT